MPQDSNMASRIQSLRALVPEIISSLKSFQSSSSKFRVLKTVHPSNRKPESPSRPSTAESPKTLFILDSSFNPPSIAHKTLALSALAKTSLPSPHRLLLLFAVMNADKAPSPAPFEQRLALMTIFAQELLDSTSVPIDIGVTKAPYYTDKSAAIESEANEWYPDSPKHVHLVGFDTLTRLFNAKYYSSFDPPFSALEPYFGHGHQLRVTMRPDEAYGSVEEQRAFVQRLADGELEKDGAKREWADAVELEEPNAEVGVSSTKIRKGAKAGDWKTVGSLCTEGVAAWVKEEALYAADDKGAKMA